MFEEKNTGNNLPAQIDITATSGNEYHLTFIAKGGGSANKSFLFQKTKSLLTEERITEFIRTELLTSVQPLVLPITSRSSLEEPLPKPP